MVRRGYQELFAGNLDVADEFIAADCVVHHGTGIELHGSEALKHLVEENLQAFPDFKFVIDDQVAKGDKVATRFSMTGTHSGAFRGIPPSGAKVEAWFLVIDQIVERCTELESGGRMIDSILTNTVLPAISTEFLTRMMEGKAIEKVHVVVEDGQFGYQFE